MYRLELTLQLFVNVFFKAFLPERDGLETNNRLPHVWPHMGYPTFSPNPLLTGAPLYHCPHVGTNVHIIIIITSFTVNPLITGNAQISALSN